MKQKRGFFYPPPSCMDQCLLLSNFFLKASLKVFQGHSLLKRGNRPFSKVKTLILRKLANFGQNSKSKTILESGKNSSSVGQNIFFKKFDQIFFLQKIDFSRLVFWSTNGKIRNQTSISIHGLLAKKIQLWGDQNIIWPQNILRVPHFKTFDP